jgi:hypothetical protein
LSTTVSVASWEKLRALAAESGQSLSSVLDRLIAQSAEAHGPDGPLALQNEGDRTEPAAFGQEEGDRS